MAAAAKTTAVARMPGSSIQVNTPGELYALAEMLYKGGLTSGEVNNPNKVAAVILAGMEVGLAPTQALGSIMLTNGRLSIYGDGAMALVRASGLLESIKEWVDGEGEDRTGHCVAKRKGEEERHYTFTIREANKAGLIERSKGKGPWATFPDRMLVMRPRGFLFRDVFPDVLRGLIFWEEAQDIQTAEVKVVGMTADTPALPPAATSASATTPTNPGGLTAAEQAKLASAAAGAVEAEQLAVISDIRVSFLNGKALTSADEQRAAWVELLGGYGVKSAREFTSAKAAEFINTEGPKHDPFRFPPDGSSKT